MCRYCFWSCVVVLGVALGLSLALPGRGRENRISRPSLTNTPPVVVTNTLPVAVTNTPPVVVTNTPPVAVTNTPPSPPPPPFSTSSRRRAPATYAPDVPKARQVLLANRRIVVKDGRSFPASFCAAQSPTARGTAPYIVISELPVSRDVRIRATANGAKVIGFLPNNALLVEADATALKHLEEDVLFMAAVEYEPTDKIQRALLDAKPDESVEATIVLLNESDRATVESFVTAEGGKMVAGTPKKGKAIMAEVPSAALTKLAGRAEVKWIEKYGRLKLLNDQAVLPQVMNVTPVWNTHGLTGEGQIIASLDSGIDNGSKTDINADFAGQIVDIIQMSDGNYKDYTGHGTHTAGSLVGLGANSSGKFKGVAHGAKLCVLSGSNADRKFGPQYEEGEEEVLFCTGLEKWHYGIKSDSWGWEGWTGYDDGYDELCYACDNVIWNNPELLEVVAAGNDGKWNYGTIDSPASAKNSLAVGMTCNRRSEAKDVINDDNIYEVAMLSSLGPTYDGRIKPDICAPGEWVVSVLSSNATSVTKFVGNTNYQYLQGTSMATPLTAGCAALVREWLMKHQGYAETKPTAALMKAILTGGAFDLYPKTSKAWLWGKAAPNNFQGWGRVDLEASIFPTNGLAVYMKDRLPFISGTNFAFTVVTTNAASLRVQLVWIDHAAEQLSGPMINNNLDLAVTSTIGGEKKIWYGNGGNEPDELNTVESVRMDEAAPGRYIVKVTCPTIPYDYTEGGAAAIYIRGAFDPDSVLEYELTDAQIAAQLSPSKPVFLVDAGADSGVVTSDAWLIADINGVPSFSIVTNGITFKHDNDGGNFWHNSTTTNFMSGTFTDIYGRPWTRVEEDMLVSLGLRGTKEPNLTAFMKTGFNMGAGTGEKTVQITGLSPNKQYVLFYMACDGTNGKSGKFYMRSGYSGTPTIDYVKGSANTYVRGSIGTAITAAANEPLLVRVSNLMPNAEGKVMIDVGGATVNVLAIAEVPSPLLYYIAQHVY